MICCPLYYLSFFNLLFFFFKHFATYGCHHPCYLVSFWILQILTSNLHYFFYCKYFMTLLFLKGSATILELLFRFYWTIKLLYQEQVWKSIWFLSYKNINFPAANCLQTRNCEALFIWKSFIVVICRFQAILQKGRVCIFASNRTKKMGDSLI